MKVTAHFHLYSSREEYLGDWEDIPVAAIPPAGAEVVLQIGNDVHGLDLEDFEQFHGRVRSISLYTFSADGSLLINVDVVGVVP